MEKNNQLGIFTNSIFFVLGFSVVFSLVGVLLQGVLASISFTVQTWLGYIGGVGAAFAVGWTPCVGAVLGAILTLAVTQSGSAFWLLLVYSLGLGIPFLVVGAFTEGASRLINKTGRWLNYFNYFFGVLLIVLGVLVFTSKLNKVANFPVLTELLVKLGSGEGLGSTLSLTAAFVAGLGSFLSPCVLPLLPAFLSYLAASSMTQD